MTRPYQRLFDWHGFGREAAAIRDAFLRNGYGPDVIAQVPDEMVDAFTIVGTVDEVRRKVREFEEFVDSVFFAQSSYGSGPDVKAQYLDAIYEVYSR